MSKMKDFLKVTYTLNVLVHFLCCLNLSLVHDENFILLFGSLKWRNK